MNHSGFTDEQQKALEAELLDVGDKLANPPSSLVELQSLLTRTEHVLSQVPQIRACHMVISVQDAICPILKVLISEKIFGNCFLSIQVAVASCINEIIRITIPDYPYTDAWMKGIFMRFLFILKQLSCGSGGNYETALHILENMAERKICLIMLDLEVNMNNMIVAMFRLFLDTIKLDHSSDIFNHMKTIMILILQESYDFDRKLIFDLYETILSSVRMDNKNTSPRSWELGKAVMENCTTILQQHLREVMKEKNLKVVDYAEIVASLCQDAHIGNDTGATEEVANTQDANEEVECIQVENKKVTTVQCMSANTSGDGVPKLDGRCQAGQETQIQVERRKRKIKPNTLMKPEEGYQHVRLGGGNGYSKKENNCVKKVRIGKRYKSRNKESTMNPDNTQEIFDKQKKTTIINHSVSGSELKDNNGTTAREHELEDVMEKEVESSMPKPAKGKPSKVEKKCSNKRKKMTNGVVRCTKVGVEDAGVILDKVVSKPAKGKPSKVEKKTSLSVSDLTTKDENEITPEKNESAGVVEKVLESSMSKPKKQSRANGEGLNKQKKATKGVVIQSDALDAHKENFSHNDADPQRDDENVIASQQHDRCEAGNVADKVVESPMSRKDKYTAHLDLEKKKEPEALGLQYGRELVDYRVMVWWPLDQTYYTGTVESYDPITKKHKIEYDDGEEEILDMSRETWHRFDDNRSLKAQTSRKREIDPSPAKDPGDKNQKKAKNRKTNSSKKEQVGPSSKRSKGEGIEFGHSVLEPIIVNVESDDDESGEINFSWKARAMGRACKQRSNASRRKENPSHDTPHDTKIG